MRLELPRCDRLSVEDLGEGLHRGGRLERRPAGQQLVEDRSQPVDVDGRTGVPR